MDPEQKGCSVPMKDIKKFEKVNTIDEVTHNEKHTAEVANTQNYVPKKR